MLAVTDCATTATRHMRYLTLTTIFIGSLSVLPATVAAQDQTFGGYPCTEDCSGHEAGYQWAEQNGLTDPSECPFGNSQSFYEGCLAYTQGAGDDQQQNDSGDSSDDGGSSDNGDSSGSGD